MTLHVFECMICISQMLTRTVKDLGALVKERRKHLGWSQSELASQIGVRRLWVSQFESGKATVHIGLALRALRALKLELRVAEVPGVEDAAGNSPVVDLDALLANNLNQSAE